LAQRLISLIIPLLSTLFSGSHGHITLFIIALFHVIWRGTINRRLKAILTTLLLFHGLLVALNLTGFIIHIKSMVRQGFFPLHVMMSDSSLISAICCILVFYLRFIFHRSQSKLIRKIKFIINKSNRIILILLAMISQIYCSYSIYNLWILISLIFIHAAVIFFVPLHQE